MKTKMVIRIIAVICILAIPAYNVCKMLVKYNISISDTNVDLSTVEELDKVDSAAVINTIRDIDPFGASEDNDGVSIQHSSGSKSQYTSDEIFEKVQNGETSYSKIFQDTLIAGDSLVAALEEYYIIDSENVMGKVSASLYHLQSISDQIISYNPKTLVLHYGENHVDDSSSAMVDNFITFYTQLLEDFKENLPDTRIVVSSIFPANESGIASSPNLKSIPDYNDRIEQMCNELDVEYLDNTPLFSGENSFYEPDGIHMKKTFYTDCWLPFLASELNLI